MVFVSECFFCLYVCDIHFKKALQVIVDRTIFGNFETISTWIIHWHRSVTALLPIKLCHLMANNIVDILYRIYMWAFCLFDFVQFRFGFRFDDSPYYQFYIFFFCRSRHNFNSMFAILVSRWDWKVSSIWFFRWMPIIIKITIKLHIYIYIHIFI